MSTPRAVPFYCPFCGEQDLRPDDAAAGAVGLRPAIRADRHAIGVGDGRHEPNASRSTSRPCPYVDEEVEAVHAAADRFEHATAEELLEWALDRFHPRMAISAAGGVDGMALIDMAWRIDPDDPRVHAGHRPPAARDVHAVRGGPRAVRHRGRVRVPGPRRRDAAGVDGGSEPDVPQRRPPRRVLQDPQGRAAEAQARHARRVGGGPAARTVEDAEEHREGGGRPRPRRHREAEPDGRLEARRRCGTTSARTRSPTTSCSTTVTRRSAARRARGRCCRANPSAPAAGGGRRRPTRSAVSTAPSGCSVTKSDLERGRSDCGTGDRGGVRAMPFGYPVFLELEGRRAVVIGETAVREGKVEGLLAAGADDVRSSPRTRPARDESWRRSTMRGDRTPRVAARRTWTARSCAWRPRTIRPSVPRSRAKRAIAASW